MALVKSMKGTQLLIQVSDGGTPTEAWTHYCLINDERTIKYNVETSETWIPDCDAPEAPAERVVDVLGVSTSISGGGIMDTGSWDFFITWLKSGASKKVRVHDNNVAGANGGAKETAFYVLTSLERTGSRQGRVTCQLTLESTSTFARVANTT